MTSQGLEPVPPSQSIVIERSLCLASLVVRGFLESAILLANTGEEREMCHELGERLNRWLNDQNFTASFTLNELNSLGLEPGTWTPTQHEQQSDHVEQLGVLLWALSLHEPFPPYDNVFPLPDLQALIGWTSDALLTLNMEKLANFPYNGTDLLSGLVMLRSCPVLAAQLSSAECWQWRIRAAQLQRTSPMQGTPADYDATIGIAAQQAHAAGAIARPIGNDFPIGNKAFGKTSQTEQDKCARITTARLLALNWLNGFATSWDEVTVAASIAA